MIKLWLLMCAVATGQCDWQVLPFDGVAKTYSDVESCTENIARFLLPHGGYWPPTKPVWHITDAKCQDTLP